MLQYFWLSDSAPKAPNKTLRKAAKRYAQFLRNLKLPIMRMKIITLGIILTTTFMTSCFMGAGTHGSLKCYQYSTPKDKLESAVLKIIENSPKIKRESLRDPKNFYHITYDQGKKDSIFDNYYNDGSYLTIKIKTDSEENEYVFRYGGDSLFWKNSGTSSIFICYAYDKFGNGGSEGNGGVDSKTLKQLTDVFESELVNIIDKELNLHHSEPE